MRWNNFYGIGNETIMLTTERDYHRVRSKEGWGSIGIRRLIGSHHTVTLTGQYLSVKLINDETRFLNSHIAPAHNYNDDNYGIARADYLFQTLDNPMLPTKGMKFLTSVSFVQNLQEKDSSVSRYSAILNFFLPLAKSLVLSIKAGGATLDGKPKFYQLNRLGGGSTLRGYRKYRFHGETMAYTQSELQFIPDIKTFYFIGKAGVLGFFDAGRVWQPGEISNTWHTGYGGGIILAPFNKIAVTATYGISKNEHDYSIKVTKAL
jgi:outer membrane protein assembly factor BamA